MQKILSTLLCWFASAICFCQPIANNDSIKASTTNPKSKENIPDIAKPALSIYPNPAKNKVTLQVSHFDPGMATVRILDIKGKLLREDNRLLTNGTEDIIMFLMLKAGIYFILVSEPGKMVRKKLVIL